MLHYHAGILHIEPFSIWSFNCHSLKLTTSTYLYRYTTRLGLSTSSLLKIFYWSQRCLWRVCSSSSSNYDIMFSSAPDWMASSFRLVSVAVNGATDDHRFSYNTKWPVRPPALLHRFLTYHDSTSKNHVLCIFKEQLSFIEIRAWPYSLLTSLKRIFPCYCGTWAPWGIWYWLRKTLLAQWFTAKLYGLNHSPYVLQYILLTAS